MADSRFLRGSDSDLIGTSTELADTNPIVGLKQRTLETDTGVQKIGDGVTPYSDLTPLPGGGSGGLSVPSIDAQGVSRGALGLEYLGAGYALGTDGSKEITFDTYVGDPTSSSGVEITDDVSTDEYTYSVSGITPVEGGLYAIGFGVEFSAPLTHPLRVKLRGLVGGDTGVPIPAGASSYYDNAVRAVRAGESINIGLSDIDAADADTLVSYVQFGVFKVGAATPLA